MSTLQNDDRLVLTLDAGGGTLRFSAARGGKPATETITLPTHGDDLGRCVLNIIEGFTRTRALCPTPPVAISFAFPGPADYPNGIIGDLPNLPAFHGGVALGPMLEEKFRLPTFINNDGDLFAYGEAIGGFLPWVNNLLAEAGNPKRYRNLFGVTLGTGFGGGLVLHDELFIGDNSCGAEIWLLRNKLSPLTNVDEGASTRAVKRVYAEISGLPLQNVPEPKEIFEIGSGRSAGNQAAALEAFRRVGEVAGDAIAQVLTIVDGLVVVGGGLSGAAPLIMPALMDEINGSYLCANGKPVRRRLVPSVYNLDEPITKHQFLRESIRKIAVPLTIRKVNYDPVKRIGLGLSKLGTSQAIALGAYAFALRKLDAVVDPKRECELNAAQPA